MWRDSNHKLQYQTAVFFTFRACIRIHCKIAKMSLPPEITPRMYGRTNVSLLRAFCSVIIITLRLESRLSTVNNIFSKVKHTYKQTEADTNILPDRQRETDRQTNTDSLMEFLPVSLRLNTLHTGAKMTAECQ